ncbi:MAG TPA: MoaD/ThiS family protein [Saprospiraceae bacterium]|nr:MoaD/ThiS family protein [Saprospiraceae bacterium]
MQLLFFGSIKEAFQADSLDWDREAKNLQELKSSLEQAFVFLADQPYAFAVNETLVRDLKSTIQPTDRIALLPPFSGG